MRLSLFEPKPSTFNREDYDALVALDEETNQPLNAEKSQKLFDAALEFGFLERDVADPKRLVVNPKISQLVGRFFQ